MGLKHDIFECCHTLIIGCRLNQFSAVLIKPCKEFGAQVSDVSIRSAFARSLGNASASVFTQYFSRTKQTTCAAFILTVYNVLLACDRLDRSET